MHESGSMVGVAICITRNTRYPECGGMVEHISVLSFDEQLQFHIFCQCSG